MNRGRALGPGRLEKRNGRWSLLWTDELGRRRRKVLAATKAEAESMRSEIVRRRDMALLGLGAQAGQDLLLAEVVGEYTADLEPRVSPRHFKQVKSRLDRTVAVLDGLSVRDLKPMHVVRFRNEAVAAGASHRTANLLVTTLQSALRWAVENEVVAHNPIAHVRKLPETADHRKCRRRAMTDDDILRFLRAAEDDDERCALLWDYHRVPQAPLWMALLETAARYGELTKATWADFDAKARVLVLRAESTKSRKQRAVPLRDEMANRLQALRRFHEAVYNRIPRASEPIFLSPEGRPQLWHTANVMRVFHRLLRAAGIRKVDAEGRKLDIHALRHTAATRFARRGVPLVHAQRILGHSDPKLTAQAYTHLDVEDLRAAVEIPAPVAEQKHKEAR